MTGRRRIQDRQRLCLPEDITHIGVLKNVAVLKIRRGERSDFFLQRYLWSQCPVASV